MTGLTFTNKRLLKRIIVLSLATMVLAGCNLLNLGKKGGQQPPQGQTTTTGGQQQPPSTEAPKVDGYWKLAFLFKDKQTYKSSIHLTQQADTFSGQGTDDADGKPFIIENGSISGGNVAFQKRYEGSNAPPIQYNGKLEMVNDATYKGPYMEGKYTVSVNGQEFGDIWQAEVDQQQAQGGQEQPPEQQPDQSVSDRIPHLSGKWECAYESDFKTIKSTMYLEQEGDLIKGHGVDLNTKEKFNIEKGWYHYPNLTLVRKYAEVKGKKGTKAARSLIFKATVSNIKDKDYDGPYMTGKTQGGGSWEAQLVR